ncbi:MAG: hypothetical protein JNJ58_10895 [Chitinophagaceae bacterium]|nr:hypothetical protein [Chitinophagaceae bacterium]
MKVVHSAGMMQFYGIMNGIKHSFIVILVLVCCSQQVTWAQEKGSPAKEDKALPNKIWSLDVIGAMDFPQADMAKRFGTSYRIGAAIKYKTQKNWIYGAKFEFITGNKMREDSLLSNLYTSQGGVIAQQGDVLQPGLFLRGYMAGLQVGKVFPVLNANANSGPMTLFSIGFMQYKINIFDKDNSFPQLRDEYKKGYDRLTNGIFIEDFLGYQYLATNKLINFYAGFNFVWGFTEGRRNYLMDVGHSDAGMRNDILIGFRMGWVVPIYKKVTEETYY